MLSGALLNHLRASSQDGLVRLRLDIMNYLVDVGDDPTRAAAFLTDMVAETRRVMVEKCRERLIEVFDEEAWRCAFRWHNARGGSVPPMVCNMMLASALTSLVVVDSLRTDGQEVVHAVDVDADGYAFPVDLPPLEGLARN